MYCFDYYLFSLLPNFYSLRAMVKPNPTGSFDTISHEAIEAIVQTNQIILSKMTLKHGDLLDIVQF